MPKPRRSQNRPGPLGSCCRNLLFAVALVAFSSLPGQAQEPELGSLSGRAIDASTQRAISDVFVSLDETSFSTVSNQEGIFRLTSLPAGSYQMTVTHLAYGEHSQTVEVPAGGELALRVVLAPTAIRIDPVVVEQASDRTLRNRARGVRINELTADEIEEYIPTSRNLADVLQQAIPSLRSVPASIANGRNCIEFRSPASVQGVRTCRSPLTFLDGVRMWDPPMLYGSLDLNTLSRVELIPPSEAGAEYGSDSSFGVLLIETKTYRTERIRTGELEPLPDHLLNTAWSWEIEGSHHSSARVFLFSALGNAVGMAAGLGVAGQCVDFDALANDFFNSSCSSWGTAGARGAALLGPALGASLAARYAGSTQLSQGRFWPAFAAAGIAILPGYAIASSASVDGFEGSKWASRVFLLLAAPAVTTIADHMYRRFTGS